MEPESSTAIIVREQTAGTVAKALRASSTMIVIYLGALLRRTIAQLAGVRWRVPLVERIELEDREVYRLLGGVAVRRTWGGEYWILLDLFGVDPSGLMPSVEEGRFVLDLADSSDTMTSELVGRRSYSFVLPRDCDPTTLETRVDGEGLAIVGRRLATPSVGAGRHRPAHAPLDLHAA